MFPLLSSNRDIHAALSDLNLLYKSTKPIPPSVICPIKVFRLIRSLLFQRNLNIHFDNFFKNSSPGNESMDGLYTSFEIAKELIIHFLPKIVNFRFFHDSKSFCISSYIAVQFLSKQSFFIMTYVNT